MKIRAEDAAVLLYAAMKASDRAPVGHYDAFKTLAQYKDALKFNVEVPKDVIEGCLYGIQLLEENNIFWHPLFTAKTFVEHFGFTYDAEHGTLIKEGQ